MLQLSNYIYSCIVPCDCISFYDFLDRNIVKVFLDENQNAYDFKRDIYDSEIGGLFRHIGFYGFQRDLLFEKAEKLSC